MTIIRAKIINTYQRIFGPTIFVILSKKEIKGSKFWQRQSCEENIIIFMGVKNSIKTGIQSFELQYLQTQYILTNFLPTFVS